MTKFKLVDYLIIRYRGLKEKPQVPPLRYAPVGMTIPYGHQHSRHPNKVVILTEGVWAFGPPKELKIADNFRLCPSA
jgi:hypothetical protein